MAALGRRAPALLGAAAAAIALAGCGGGSSEDASKLIRETFANAQKVRSGRLNLQVTLAPQGSGDKASQSLALTLGGPFSRVEKVPRFAFTMQSTVGGASEFSGGIVSTGSAGYLTYRGVAYRLPAAQYASFRRTFDQVQGFAQPKLSGGSIPWLKDPKVVDEEPLDGVRTVHVTAGVDVPKLLTAISGRAKLTAAQRRQVEQVVRSGRFDFYTGKKDKLLRRVTIHVRLDLRGSARAAAGGLRAADMDIEYGLSQVNRPQHVSAPANAQPFSQLASQTGAQALGGTGLLGALGGGSASTSPGGGSSAAPSAGGSGGSGSLSPKVQRYTRCLQRAGSDVAKAQKCASLLK